MYGVNQPLQIEDVEVDEPRAGEVLVKTSASGVCHSDLHFMEGSYPTRTPIVLGHESAGVVEKVGPGVTGVKAGDRVVVAFVTSCGQCDNCVQGKPYLCNNSASLGRNDRLTLNGQPMAQFANMSAFAEYQLVSQNACVHVPDGVPMEVACLVGCSVMTGVGAVTNTAKIPVGSTVAVIGAGGVGLNVDPGRETRRCVPHHRRGPPGEQAGGCKGVRRYRHRRRLKGRCGANGPADDRWRRRLRLRSDWARQDGRAVPSG